MKHQILVVFFFSVFVISGAILSFVAKILYQTTGLFVITGFYF
jgi:hypothetical protein